MRFSTLASLVILFGLAASAWAYIPPASFILRSLARTHSDNKTIQVKSTITALDSSGLPSSTRIHETTVFNPQNATMRSWATDDSGKILYMVDRQHKNMPMTAEVLFDGSSARIIETLLASGVDVTPETPVTNPPGVGKSASDKLSLHRWNRQVAWVIGGNTKTKGLVPQIWVEKDSFAPLRLIGPTVEVARDETKLFDLQFENLRQYEDYYYPRSAVLYEVGKKNPLLKAEVADVTLNYVETLPKEKVVGWTDAGNSAPSSVRQLIETYYHFVR